MMKKLAPTLLLLPLCLLLVRGCQNDDLTSTLDATSNVNQIMTQPRVISLGTSDLTSSISPLLSTPAITPETYDHTMFVESQAEDFEFKGVEQYSGFVEEEAISPTQAYHAFEACDPSCFIYVEDLRLGKTYKITSSTLRGNRGYSNLIWSDELILEFTLVTQPHHGVSFKVDVESHELIDASPVPLD